MTKAPLGAAIATALLAGAAYAQATPPGPAPQPSTVVPGGSSGATTFTLAAADETKLKDWITAQKTASVPAPAGFAATVGATVPATIVLHPIPASAGVATVGSNQYAMVADRIFLVNPADRKIVYLFAATTVAAQGSAQNQGQIVVQQPAPSIRVDQAPPQVTVQQAQPSVSVRQAQPEIIVQQPAPTITVDIPPPQIIVRMPKPEVNVAQAQPQVQVTQPPPKVEVIQPQQQAQVNVQPVQPQVNVTQGQGTAAVDVQQLGTPTIRYERAEPQVKITQQSGQPVVKFEQLDQLAAADARPTGATPAPATPSTTTATATPNPALPAVPGAANSRQLALNDVKAMEVFNRNNDKLGSVDHFVTSTDNQTFLVLASGGFLGIGERKVLVPLNSMWTDGKRLMVDLTDDQVKRMTEWKADIVGYRDLTAPTLQVRTQ